MCHLAGCWQVCTLGLVGCWQAFRRHGGCWQVLTRRRFSQSIVTALQSSIDLWKAVYTEASFVCCWPVATSAHAYITLIEISSVSPISLQYCYKSTLTLILNAGGCSSVPVRVCMHLYFHSTEVHAFWCLQSCSLFWLQSCALVFTIM